MIESLSGENSTEKTYVLLSGGSNLNNFMHYERFVAMLNTLQEEGFTFEQSPEELAAAEDNMLAGTSEDGGRVYICPGYLTLDQYEGRFEEILEEAGEVDVVASTYYASPFLEAITEKEEEQNKNIQVGAIDCFCETNSEAFNTKDAFGNSKIDFIGGKCAAMAAPSFVAMYNAVTGHPEVVRDDGEAFWLNQDFWYASTAEEYNTLSEAADNVYKNVYGTKDIMAVLADYEEEAGYTDYKEFVANIAQ